jgi:hypothetical protein
MLMKVQHVLITAARLSLRVMSCCLAYEASDIFFWVYLLCYLF